MTTFRIDKNHDLVIELDEEDVEEIVDLREDGWSDNDIFLEVIEYQLCNGWSLIPPEKIGALTSSFILSEEVEEDDYGNYLSVGWVYWNTQYQLRSEVDDMLDQGYVIFQGVE